MPLSDVTSIVIVFSSPSFKVNVFVPLLFCKHNVSHHILIGSTAQHLMRRFYRGVGVMAPIQKYGSSLTF